MKDEGTATAKMKHIKQCESQDCGAKIASFQQKYWMCCWLCKCKQLPEKKKVSFGMQVSQNLMKVLDVGIKESLDEENRHLHPKYLCGMLSCLITWKQQMHGAVPVLCRQCLLVQMSSKLGCRVLAAVTMLQSTGCAKELCNN